MSESKTEEEFQFLESSESKFYRNFLRRWELFYPGSRPRQHTEERLEARDEEQAETKNEFQFSKEISKEGAKKIFDYKSKKYVEQ